MRRRGREENDVVPLDRKIHGARRLPQNPLAPVAKDGVAQALCRHERDPPRRVPRGEHADAEEGVVESPPPREDPLEVTSGLDGPHQAALHGQALAALRTTTGQDGAAALGGHAGTEAVGGGALALVGLIGTLHVYSSRLGMNVDIEQ